ncbi:MAG TPA: hypothetical protein VGJ87_08960 [Roseiflexaceae bacterium]|jgi:uncharacterized membrane protein
MNTILGIFDDPLAARRAVETLRDSPLLLDDVSIISRATEGGVPVSNDDDVSAGEGAAIGAVWGGLVGLATLLIPGVGPFVAGGAIFAALTGVVTGAVVGGVAAALIDFGGISEADARRYESMIYEGKTLVAVKAREEDAPEVRRILTGAGAETVRGDQAAEVGATTRQVHIAMYDEQGRRVDQDFTSAMPATGAHDPYATREMPGSREREVGQSWTKGEDVGEGQGTGPRKDTGAYDAHQWVGEGQGPSGHTEDDAQRWTGGEFVGEGQGTGPRKDTGAYDTRQWVGEGQDEEDTPPDDPAKRRP